MASSAESEERGSVKKKKLTRLGSFSCQEVFRAWATDSLLKPNTIETLVEVHQVDSLPAVLALRGKDIANLGLPIGQARLFHDAVVKLHAEYTYQEPFSPATRVDVEFPKYKSLLDDIEGSPVERFDRNAADYFNFHFVDNASEEMGVEVGEHFCDGKNQTEQKLLPEESDDDDDDETRSGCACQRWLFISIFMPLILVISLLACIAWILQWPFHRFCPVGKTFSKIFKATEFLAKLPVIAIHWAIGRRRRAWDREPDRVEETESRRNYGGTDDVSMSELEKSNT